MKRHLDAVLIAGLVLVILVVGLVLLLARSRPLPEVKLPEPNGYLDIVKAGKLLHFGANAESIWANPSPTAEEYRACLSTNQEALQLVRAGLSHECRVPVEYSTSFLDAHLEVLGKIKSLARTLQFEGRLAELEQRPSDAAHSYVDIVRLGNEVGRGGLLIDALVGTACQAIGLAALQAVVPRLEAHPCRDLLRSLETIDTRRESWTNIVQCELRFGQRSMGWRGMVVGWITAGQTRQTLQKAEQKWLLQITTLRQVEIELAARAFAKEKGRRAETAAELIPDYLKSIPRNPANDTPLVYHP
jgi:hypothetical protein